MMFCSNLLWLLCRYVALLGTFCLLFAKRKDFWSPWKSRKNHGPVLSPTTTEIRETLLSQFFEPALFTRNPYQQSRRCTTVVWQRSASN